MVKSQLDSFTPVGIEMIVVIMPKKPLTLAPEPLVKTWWSQTKKESTPINDVAYPIDL
jgi:hypothetical protein